MAAHQAPPSLGFSRQEYWSGLPFPSPMNESEKWKWSHSVMSDSQRPHGLQPTRLLHPWDFPGKSTGVDCHHLLWMAIESEGFQERGHHTHVHRHTHTCIDTHTHVHRHTHTHTHTHRKWPTSVWGRSWHYSCPSGFFFVSLPLLCPSGKDSWSLGLLVWTIERPPDSSGDKVTSESEVAQSYLILIPWTVAYQASLSMEFSKQEYWSGLPFPSPGDLPEPGAEPRSPTLQADRCFTVWATREASRSPKTVTLKLVTPQDPFPLLKIIADLKESLCVVSIEIYHVRN